MRMARLLQDSKDSPTRARFSCGALLSVTMRQDLLSIIWYFMTYFASYITPGLNHAITKLFFNIFQNKISAKIEIISCRIGMQRHATDEKRTRVGQA